MKTIKKTSILFFTMALLASVTKANITALSPEGDPRKAEKTESALERHEGGNSYTTSIGFRGGLTSGFSVKHFIGSTTALEGIIGSSALYRGLSLTGLYELHKGNGFGVDNLTWEYGGGGRIGFYNMTYYDYWGKRDYQNVLSVGIVGLFGMEYKFDEVPFTVSVNAMPFIDFVTWGPHFIDGSVSIRYILK